MTGNVDINPKLSFYLAHLSVLRPQSESYGVVLWCDFNRKLPLVKARPHHTYKCHPRLIVGASTCKHPGVNSIYEARPAYEKEGPDPNKLSPNQQ